MALNPSVYRLKGLRATTTGQTEPSQKRLFPAEGETNPTEQNWAISSGGISGSVAIVGGLDAGGSGHNGGCNYHSHKREGNQKVMHDAFSPARDGYGIRVCAATGQEMDSAPMRIIVAGIKNLNPTKIGGN